MIPERLPPAAKELYELARKAREKSYSPYSGHKVGAAIRARDGRVYQGANVENSSYGATVCAERVAIASAVVDQGGKLEIAEICVVTDASPAWPPCGMCRQVIAEFVGGNDVQIHAANLKGEVKTFKFGELVPEAFTPAYLRSSSTDGGVTGAAPDTKKKS